MRLLLYCCKAKPYLYQHFSKEFITLNTYDKDCIWNGKIVAECDYEVEEIRYGWYSQNIVPKGDHYYTYYKTSKIEPKEFYKKSCLNWEQLNSYLNDYDSQKFEGGYAIHIKNLHIFDEPRDLSEFTTFTDFGKPITKAPQNMCNVCDDLEHNCERYILISIRPEYLVDILNGNKTIEIRKKVLKDMLR